MTDFPRVSAPRPYGFDTWTPGNREAFLNEEMRGLHQMPCPKCRRAKNGNLLRCPDHRNWGK